MAGAFCHLIWVRAWPWHEVCGFASGVAWLSGTYLHVHVHVHGLERRRRSRGCQAGACGPSVYPGTLEIWRKERDL